MTLQAVIKKSFKKECFFTRQDFLDRGDKTIFSVDGDEDLGGSYMTGLNLRLPGSKKWEEAFPLFDISWVLASDWVLYNQEGEQI